MDVFKCTPFELTINKLYMLHKSCFYVYTAGSALMCVEAHATTAHLFSRGISAVHVAVTEGLLVECFDHDVFISHKTLQDHKLKEL